jgi:hypothetical protein
VAAKKDQANSGANVEETKQQEQQVEQAAAEEQAEVTEFYEVRVNPKLELTDKVSIGELVFYRDPERNRREGNWIVDNVQWESIKGQKDSATGLNLVTKKSTVQQDN